MNNEKPSYEELELKIKKLELENLNLKTSQFEISKDTELAEKQLLKSNSIINSFFLNSTQYMGIIEIFPEKNDLRYIIINKSAGEYLQKRPDEVEGKLGTEIGVP